MNKAKLLAASLCLAATASSSFGARFYAQPSIAIAEVDGFDATVGGSLAAGFLFADKHALEIDFSQFSVDDNYSDSFSSGELQYDFKPVLLSYRYEFPITAKLYGSIGASIGATFQEISSRQTLTSIFGPGTWNYERKDEAFTAGFSAGIGYRFTDRASAFLSAKTLRASKSDILSENTYSILQLGLNCRF
jgi:hypothetical protein